MSSLFPFDQLEPFHKAWHWHALTFEIFKMYPSKHLPKTENAQCRDSRKHVAIQLGLAWAMLLLMFGQHREDIL